MHDSVLPRYRLVAEVAGRFAEKLFAKFGVGVNTYFMSKATLKDFRLVSISGFIFGLFLLRFFHYH